jgi:hypothetical protein
MNAAILMGSSSSRSPESAAGTIEQLGLHFANNARELGRAEVLRDFSGQLSLRLAIVKFDRQLERGVVRDSFSDGRYRAVEGQQVNRVPLELLRPTLAYVRGAGVAVHLHTDSKNCAS